jgi:hypothetical protein
MEDPVLAEAHRMTSRAYRGNKEVTPNPISSQVFYKITQKKGEILLLPLGSFLITFLLNLFGELLTIGFREEKG